MEKIRRTSVQTSVSCWSLFWSVICDWKKTEFKKSGNFNDIFWIPLPEGFIKRLKRKCGKTQRKIQNWNISRMWKVLPKVLLSLSLDYVLFSFLKVTVQWWCQFLQQTVVSGKKNGKKILILLSISTTVQSWFNDIKFVDNLWFSDYCTKTIFQFTTWNHSI